MIVKNQLSLDRVRFTVGNFIEYLKFGKKKWDIVYCAGTLYHMDDPANVISLIAGRTKNLVLSTHVFDVDEMKSADQRTEKERYPTSWLEFIDQESSVVERCGIKIKYFAGHFPDTVEHTVSGQGASHSSIANFMLFDDIVRVVKALGGDVVHAEKSANNRGPNVEMVITFPDPRADWRG